MRAAWPQHLPMSVRISAHDWVEGGITPDDAVRDRAGLQGGGRRHDRLLVGPGQQAAKAGVRPHVPDAVRRPHPQRGRHRRPSRSARSPKPTTSTASSPPAAPTCARWRARTWPTRPGRCSRRRRSATRDVRVAAAVPVGQEPARAQPRAREGDGGASAAIAAGQANRRALIERAARDLSTCRPRRSRPGRGQPQAAGRLPGPSLRCGRSKDAVGDHHAEPARAQEPADLRFVRRAARPVRPAAATPPTCKAVVVTGAGGNFCSGGDVHEIIGPLVQLKAPELLMFTRMTGDLVKAMRACPQPIVAAIDGVCAGAGAIVAMASDLRLGTARSKTAFLFNRVGLAGCDMGACAHAAAHHRPGPRQRAAVHRPRAGRRGGRALGLLQPPVRARGAAGRGAGAGARAGAAARPSPTA